MKKTQTSARKTGLFNGYNNRAHKIPDPKLLNVQVKYALSLNPSSRPVQYVEKNDTFKYNFRHYYNTILSKINKCVNCQIDIVPEISATGKYHYHGYITITNLANFMLYDICILRQYFAFEIDTITDMKVWETYVNKGSHYMLAHCANEKIPYNMKTGEKPVKLRDEDKLFDVSYEWDDEIENEIDDDTEVNKYHNNSRTLCPDSTI